MKIHPRAAAAGVAAALLASGLAGAFAPSARADSSGTIDFESYAVGNIDGQAGWSKTGPFDVVVANVSDFGAASGYGFGSKALRVSDAATSGSFGDQAFSPGLANPAGEGAQPGFQATFKFGSTLATEQTGMHLSVSPDSGDGSRMSYLRFEDQSDGIHVFFDDVTGGAFTDADIATISRSSAHTIAFDMTFVAGPSNDVVRIYIDGTLEATGTSWEDYYRYDPEQGGNGNVVPAVRKLLFKEGGDANVDDSGNGYLIDGVSLTSGPATPGPCTFTTVDTTDTLDGDCVTDHTIVIPAGHTLDGAHHTITAVDPAGGHFKGAVVQNGNTIASVRNLTVTSSGLANVCDGGADRLRGILFDNAAGSITNNVVTGVRQGHSGCQEGNAIEVRNVTPSGTAAAPVRIVTISGNTVSNYQKNGITANGGVTATITGNVVTGDGPITYIAQNGIQYGFGAGGTLKGNTASGNYYSPASDIACGVLFYEAGGVKASNNTLFANERDQCNFGKGGGHVVTP